MKRYVGSVIAEDLYNLVIHWSSAQFGTNTYYDEDPLAKILVIDQIIKTNLVMHCILYFVSLCCTSLGFLSSLVSVRTVGKKPMT